MLESISRPLIRGYNPMAKTDIFVERRFTTCKENQFPETKIEDCVGNDTILGPYLSRSWSGLSYVQQLSFGPSEYVGLHAGV